jgi:phenylacetate-CoA ligase
MEDRMNNSVIIRQINSMLTIANKVEYYKRMEIPDNIQSLKEFSSIRCSSKEDFLKSSYDRKYGSKEFSLLFWTGGTSGKSFSIEWYQSDIDKMVKPLSLYLSRSLRNTETYALSTISPCLSSYGNEIVEICKINKYHLINCNGITEANFQYIQDFMKSLNIKIIFTTPIGVDKLYSEIEESEMIKLKTIISAGAPLNENMYYKYMQKYPHIELIGLYGCTEVGMVGITCKKFNRFHTFADTVFLEIENNTTHELILTSLQNRRTPIIRYKNGDLGRLEDHTCSCGFCGKTLFLEGRKTETLYIGGTKIDASQIKELLHRLKFDAHFYQCVYDKRQSLIELNVPETNRIIDKNVYYKIIYEINPIFYLKLINNVIKMEIRYIKENNIMNKKNEKYPIMLEIDNF